MAEDSASSRDLRLDFFRGLALFCIFIDHIHGNFFALFTVQSIGLSDAAEMFILISGFTAGLVFGQVFDRRGFIVAGVRIYQRVWQLYVAHVFLFVLFMAMVAHTVSALNSSLYVEELGAADFLREPDVAVVMALSLLFQPPFMDILPLYIVLLGFLPVIFVCFRLSAVTTLSLSFLLWLTVQFYPDLTLPAYPGPDAVWFFNPFAWQFLFFVGAYVGWRGVPDERWHMNTVIVAAAVAIALAGLVVRASWAIHALYDPAPAVLLGMLSPLLSKTNLSIFRLLNILALAVLVLRYIGPRDGWLRHSVSAPFILCGRHSLHVFCLGILLSIIGRVVIDRFYGGIPLQAAVTVGGILAMIAVAGFIDWVRDNVATTRGGGQRVNVGGGT